MTNPEDEFRRELSNFLKNYEQMLCGEDLREKVLILVGVFHGLRRLGSRLIPSGVARSARDRILLYFRKYPLTIIHGDELMVVAGIQDWPRRVRELRVQFGWQIASGYTLKEMAAEGEAPEGIEAVNVKPEEYILLSTDQDRDIAHRWALANDIRRERISTKDRILRFLRENIGRNVSGEEIRYVAKNSTEWARRLRELRTEEGWPIVTRFTGDPDMPAGFYRLERDRQEPAHDRAIPDKVRSHVLERDNYRCTRCGWDRSKRTPDDPRQFLELHHAKPHAKGGKNAAENLVVLCNVCHDDTHAGNGK